MEPSSCHQLPPSNTLPPPSPTWAEVAGGRGEERRRQLPAATQSTHAPAPRLSPCATTQFETWLRCRKEGYPAKLVLETDGTSEEVSLWFRRTARAPTEAPPSETAPPRRRRRRPGRDRVRRQRQAERERAARSSVPPVPAEAEAGMDMGLAPSSEEPVELSPPAKSPPAKRPRTRAAARGGGRSDPPTPEMSRAVGIASPGALNASVGEELRAEREEQPDSPSPPPTPPPPHIRDGDGDWTATEEKTESSFDEDYEDEEWEDGRRLNTRNPPWDKVFPAYSMRCRFCRKLPPEPGGDGDCLECSEFTTFQLVKRFAPRWRYPKEY